MKNEKLPTYLRLTNPVAPFHSLEGMVFRLWNKRELYVQSGSYIHTDQTHLERSQLPFKSWTPSELTELGELTPITNVEDMIPAHPFTDDPEDRQTPGMTMLDYIAIHSFSSCIPHTLTEPDELAKRCYIYALAMMKEREKYIYTSWLDDGK